MICDIWLFIVTMQAQKEIPPDMQCKDKFLLQSVRVNDGADPKDITPEMVWYIMIVVIIVSCCYFLLLFDFLYMGWEYDKTCAIGFF